MNPRRVKAAKRIPDLYKLLSLTPLESEPKKIRQAMGNLAKRARADGNSDSELSARIAQVIKLAEHHLLSTEHKPAYDRVWLATFGQPQSSDGEHLEHQNGRNLAAASTSPEQPGALENTTEIAALRGLLPNGDPRAAFDLARYLQHLGQKSQAAGDSNDDDQQFADLLKALEKSAQERSHPSAPSSTVVQPTTNHGTQPLPEQDFFRADVSRAPIVSPSGASPSRQIQKQRKPRSRRERPIVLGIIGTMSLMIAVLGIVVWFRSTNDDEPMPPKPGFAADQTVATKSPRRSGLPSVSGLDAMEKEREDKSSATRQTGSAMTKPSEPQSSDGSSGIVDPFAEPLPSQNIPPSMPGPGSPVQTASQTTSKQPPMTQTQTTQPQTTQTETESSVSQPGPSASPTAPLSDAELRKWSAKLANVKKLTGQQKYPAAKAALAEAAEQALAPKQTEQLAQLTQVVQLSEDVYEALVSAIESLSAGEVITAGKSTQLSFVDGNRERVVFRINGTNRTFKLTELPVGIVYALVDLKMDSEHPNSKARRAAFTLLHPRAIGNSLNEQQAREMMNAAISANAVSPELLDVFDDNFGMGVTEN